MAIEAIARIGPDAAVGVGAIVGERQIEAAIEGGARFLVSPGASPRLAEAGANTAAPFIPGVAAVSEALAMRALGIRTLKLFPAEAVGGARLLAAIAAPLPDLVFCPTGGVNPANAKAYLALLNVACVGGSWMRPKEAMLSGDFGLVERLAREAATRRSGVLLGS